jgi:fructose-1,6-bisphosphatase
MNKINEDPFQEEFNKIIEVQNAEDNSKPFILNYIPSCIYDIYCNIYNGVEEYCGI